MQTNQNIEPLYRTNLIIWAAFLMSQVVFLVVIFLVKKELFSLDFTKPLLGKEPIVLLIIGLIALMNLGLSFYMKSQMTQEAINSQKPAGIQTAQILAYALCESVSVLGLVLAVVFDYQYFFAFLGLAILGILLHFPKRNSFIASVYKK